MVGSKQRKMFRPGAIRNNLPAPAAKCSTMGPSESAGKKVSAPTIRNDRDEQAHEQANRWWERAQPAGVTFLSTMDPAIAIAGIIIRKRPTSMSAASE